MKISAPLLIPIARQNVSRHQLPVQAMRLPNAVRDEVQLASRSLSENPSPVDFGRIQSKAVDIYKMTAAIDSGKGDGDLIGVDVFA